MYFPGRQSASLGLQICCIFMFVFYFFAAIVIWLGILSLRGGLSFAAYVRRETARPLPDFTPFASVIAPCRGLEDGLRENIAALFRARLSGLRDHLCH